jgi:Spx/MgsR family transcriptional regulator
MKLYGIPNCNTVKKARDWLETNGIPVEFHDYKKHKLDSTTLENWLSQADWTTLINRNGLTWRKLADVRKQGVKDMPGALALMLEYSSVIKRPLLEQDGTLLHVGFDAAAYSTIFNLPSWIQDVRYPAARQRSHRPPFADT